MENKKKPRLKQKSQCNKCVYETKEIADEYIERKRKDIGSKFVELRSYKCEVCKKWHHTSNMTPIYLSRIVELELELEKASRTIASITNLVDIFNKRQSSEEIKEIRKELVKKSQKLVILEQSVKDLFKK